MRIIDRATVYDLFPVDSAAALMRSLMIGIEAGEVFQPLRTVLRPSGEASVLGSMPAFLSTAAGEGYGLKAVVVNPDNSAIGLETHLGVVLVFHHPSGRPDAVLEAGAITGIRTAAVSAVATDVLAAPGMSTLALVGAGLQARLHLKALARVRPIGQVRVWSRSWARADELVRWAGERFGCSVVLCSSPADAAGPADIVCTVTSAREPVLALADVRPGVHVNAVGACFPTSRELATDLMCAAAITVDNVESALAEAGDVVIPLSEGRLGKECVSTTLGAVLAGKSAGRESEREITVFESVGLAAQDVASALFVARRAREEDRGVEVAFD